jgi:hypothetical protein
MSSRAFFAISLSSEERRPCFTEFRDERLFPAGIRGPVLRFHGSFC